MTLYIAATKLGSHMSQYRRGRRAEWIAKEKLISIGFPVVRVAGSKGYDLVLGGFPVEVKMRSAPPKSLEAAKCALIEDGEYIAGPLQAFFGSSPLLTEHRKIANWARKLTPEHGLLIVHIPHFGEVIVSRCSTRLELLDFLKSRTHNQNRR